MNKQKFCRHILVFLSVGTLIFVLLDFSSLVMGASENPFQKNKTKDLRNNDEESVKRASKAVMIVLDCSGSMSEPAENGQTKMFAAKKVLEKVLAEIDPSIKVGLRLYGSADPSTTTMITRCEDTVLLVPPNTGNRATIINKLREINPSGATPISVAMRQAAKDLENIPAEQKSVVLISDGIDTCGYDPCSLAQSMKESGAEVQFNVVGFGIKGDFAAIEQLDCIAKSTEGKFYTADTSAQLADGIMDGINTYSLTVTGTVKELP